MNIFILDMDIEQCARYHCDQHVNKMILESAQILCTALNKKGFSTPYRSTHMNHPCVHWVEASYDNFLWLNNLALALNREAQYRYDKTEDHASVKVLNAIMDHRFDAHGLTAFAQAMPDQYKDADDPVAAYRAFYSHEKTFATWRKRDVPDWYVLGKAA